MYPSWNSKNRISRAKLLNHSEDLGPWWKYYISVRTNIFSTIHAGKTLVMTGVENFSIYWPRRHVFGPGRQLQQIYGLRKPPEHILPRNLDSLHFLEHLLLCHLYTSAYAKYSKLKICFFWFKTVRKYCLTFVSSNFLQFFTLFLQVDPHLMPHWKSLLHYFFISYL